MKPILNKALARRPPKPAGSPATRLSWRDWLTLLFSTVAFLLSIFTAYINYLRVVDNFSVVILPGITMRAIGESFPVLSLDMRSNLIFANTGTRPAAVVGISLLVMRPSEAYGPEECKSEPGPQDVLVRLVTTALSVEAGQLIPVTAGLDTASPPDGASFDDKGVLQVKLAHATPNVPGYSVRLCMIFDLATPRTRQASVRQPIFVGQVTFTPGPGTLWLGDKDALRERTVAASLLRYDGHIFAPG